MVFFFFFLKFILQIMISIFLAGGYTKHFTERKRLSTSVPHADEQRRYDRYQEWGWHGVTGCVAQHGACPQGNYWEPKAKLLKDQQVYIEKYFEVYKIVIVFLK